MIKITANESVLKAWQTLGESIKQMGCVVQNDQELTDQQFQEWAEQAHKLQNDLKCMVATTMLSIWGMPT